MVEADLTESAIDLDDEELNGTMEAFRFSVKGVVFLAGSCGGKMKQILGINSWRRESRRWAFERLCIEKGSWNGEGQPKRDWITKNTTRLI